MDIKEEANRILTIPILYQNSIHKNINFNHIKFKKEIFFQNTIQQIPMIRFQIFLVFSTGTISNKTSANLLRGGPIFILMDLFQS